MARVKELFYSGDWTVSASPGYGPRRRANPFDTFQAIPAQARYQFMLDNAEYFIRTFIRGPVCRGNIASDVIRDNFWALFQDPAHDLYLTDAAYRDKATPLLSMPGQIDDVGSVLTLWHSYRDKRNEYEALRSKTYARAPAPSWSTLWAGNDNASLSIFRHYDSASVNKGLIGEIPQTLWLFDFPILERTYYQLAVNFDIFGNVAHQAQTRLYFALQLLVRYGNLNGRPDPINRCSGAYCARQTLEPELRYAEQALSRLTSRPAAGLQVTTQLPEASMLRIQASAGAFAGAILSSGSIFMT